MAASTDYRNPKNKLRMLFLLEAWLEAPMFLLALVWLWLFGIELVRGPTPQQQILATIAGGLENRAIVKHLALFHDEP